MINYSIDKLDKSTIKCNCENNHIIRVNKFVFRKENGTIYYPSDGDFAGNLMPLFNKQILDIVTNDDDNCSVCFRFDDSQIVYDIDYVYNGEDEEVVENSSLYVTENYLPISYCPYCGKKFEFEIISTTDISNEINDIVEEIKENEKQRVSKKRFETTKRLEEKIESLFPEQVYSMIKKRYYYDAHIVKDMDKLGKILLYSYNND